MQENGYFQLITMGNGYGVRIFPPAANGQAVAVTELIAYLEQEKIPHDMKALHSAILKNEETDVLLGAGPCPVCHERYQLTVAEDGMLAQARFYPRSSTGEALSLDEFIKDMRFKGIAFGLQLKELSAHFQNPVYCTDLVVAKGKPPRHGQDGRIEYYFNTEVNTKPVVMEDGSVDYKNFNTINQCKAGDVLARVIPADPGDVGTNVQGAHIRPRAVKQAVLHYEQNIQISEDKLTITSKVDGHVSLVEGRVFVSNVYEVENVDLSTGNIDFEGSVQVNGNVATGFTIKAGGNVVVKGIVEGAEITAGGDIILINGMKGVFQGKLKAEGNVTSRFLENCEVFASGSVSSGSIINSKVASGSEVEVTGKRGFISGGSVQATAKITVKTLGSEMGATTVVEVGANPELRVRYNAVREEVAGLVQEIRMAQPIIANFKEKSARGVRFREDQVKHVMEMASKLEQQSARLQTANTEMRELEEQMNVHNRAEVVVTGVAYPGTTIIIGDNQLNLKAKYQYCKFIREAGEVCMRPL